MIDFRAKRIEAWKLRRKKPDYDPSADPFVDAYRVEGYPPRGHSVFVCLIYLDEYSTIIWAPAFLRKFTNQDVENLIQWGRCKIGRL